MVQSCTEFFADTLTEPVQVPKLTMMPLLIFELKYK